jgi:hypothetical protein
MHMPRPFHRQLGATFAKYRQFDRLVGNSAQRRIRFEQAIRYAAGSLTGFFVIEPVEGRHIVVIFS